MSDCPDCGSFVHTAACRTVLSPRAAPEPCECIHCRQSGYARGVADERARHAVAFQPDCDRECTQLVYKGQRAHPVKHSPLCRHHKEKP